MTQAYDAGHLSHVSSTVPVPDPGFRGARPQAPWPDAPRTGRGAALRGGPPQPCEQHSPRARAGDYGVRLQAQLARSTRRRIPRRVGFQNPTRAPGTARRRRPARARARVRVRAVWLTAHILRTRGACRRRPAAWRGGAPGEKRVDVLEDRGAL